jgi:hypothetical protein
LDHKTTTMQKLIVIQAILVTLNAHSQNLVQSNILTNSGLLQSQSPPQQVFASNMMVGNSNKNIESQAQGATNVVQGRQRRASALQNNTGSNPMVQQAKFAIDNINDDIQVQGNIIVLENNGGNALGNETNPIEQIASLNIPAIQLGSGNMDLSLNLDINMPKINLKTIKFKGKGSSASKGNHNRIRQLEKKLAKFNRKTAGKLSFKKKLKIKVDSCFKW